MMVSTAKMLLRDRVVLAGAALCLVLLAGTGWAFYGRGRPAAAGGQKGPTATYSHVHCPACGEELPYHPTLDGQSCTACKLGAGGVFVPTVGPTRRDGAGGGRSVGFALIGAVLLQGLAYLIVVRARGLRRAAEAARNRPLLSSCPFCGRRICYPATQAGTGYACPVCKTAFVLPGAWEPT